MLSQVNEGAHEIRCPGLKEGRLHGICNAPWDHPEMPDIFAMTVAEEEEFLMKQKENLLLFVLNYIQCPTCRVLIPRPSDDPKLTRTHCDKCEETEGVAADFCYKCGEEWKYDDICMSDDCTFKKQNKILQECSVVEIDYISNVPTVRACPNCNTLYEHLEACRHMKCKTPKCKNEEFEYCHVCLSEWTSHYTDENGCRVAPRQVLKNPHIFGLPAKVKQEVALHIEPEEAKQEEPEQIQEQ